MSVDYNQHLSLDQIREIVQSVGKPLPPYSDQWNRNAHEALRRGIGTAVDYYIADLSLNTNYRFKKNLHDLNRVADLLYKTIHLLKTDDIRDAVYEDSSTIPNVEDLSDMLNHIRKIAKARQAAIDDDGQSVVFLHSPFEWLIGRRLANVYRDAFKLEPGFSISRKTGEISGPFIRFCQACLAVLKIDRVGKPYTAAAIAEALKKVRSSRKA